MSTPPIPPRPVSYVSSATAGGQDQTTGDDNLTERHDKPMPAKKPMVAKKPSLPAAKVTENSPPPKPLRKSHVVAEKSSSATVTSAPPKPARPRSAYEDKSAVPPRPTRPPGVKPPAHKPASVVSKVAPSKPSSEPVATRPAITVISAKPMVSDSVPPPESSHDAKPKERPNKPPIKPARPPQMKHKDDEDKTLADTVEDLKSNAKQFSSMERPVVKKRASQESVPVNVKTEDEESKRSPVPLKRKKSNVKVPSPEPAAHQETAKVRDSKKPPPPRPSYSIDEAMKHKSSSEEPPAHGESDDQHQLKPVARSRTLSASKVHKPPPPKPSQPLTTSAVKTVHDNPDEVSEPTKPTISKRMSLPRTGTLTDQDVPHIDKSDSKESTEKLPTARPRAHSGSVKKRPPKPAPPKLPPPKPAPPKSAPSKSHEPDNTAEDKHNEDAPAEHLQESLKVLPRTDVSVPVVGQPDDKTSSGDDTSQTSLHPVGIPHTHSETKHPPKPVPPKPALFKSHMPDNSASDKMKDLNQDKLLEGEHPSVSANADESMVTSSGPVSEQGESTVSEESGRPAISKRSSSKKWRPPVAKKQAVDETEDKNSSSERTATQEETSDQPPPRPLPPKDEDYESDKQSANQSSTSETMEEKDQEEPIMASKKPVDQAPERKLPTQVQKPSPPQTNKPLPPQVAKPLPPQTKKSLPPQVTKPLPPHTNKPSPPQVIKPLPPQVEKEEHNEAQSVEDQPSSRPKSAEPEKEKKHKPPRPAMPSAPPMRKTPEPESHSANDPPPLPKRPTPGHPLYHYVTNKPRATAKFDYHPEDEEELSFLKDNLIELIERVDDHWFYACNVDDDCKEGMVLEKYLKIIKRLPGEDKLSYLNELPSAVAMFDFEGENEDELSFVAGDLIILEEKIDDVWLKGYTRSPQESGIFPAKFVEVVEPLPPDNGSTSGSMPEQSQSSMTTDNSSNAESSLGNQPYCIVQSQFISEGSNELSIEPGDKVVLIERVNEDWLKGKLNERIGIFPLAFVDIKVDLPVSSKQPTDVSKEDTISPANDTAEKMPAMEKTLGKCKALFEFLAEQEGELSLKVGDTIITTAWINDEWLQGTCNDKEGIFPVQFVQILEDLPKGSALISEKLPKNISAETDLSPRAKAIRDYTSSDSDELNFKVGDMIYLLNKVDDGKFLEGELNNKVGKFPSAYVEVVVALP